VTTRVARLRRLAPPQGPDRSLLTAFLADRSEAAFAELVRRHGPLVFGVCRRVLGHTQDAEDAFQATFLVLARKAGTVTRTETLSPWLYAVAVRTARELRHMRDRRRKHELASGPRERAGDREANHRPAHAGRSPDFDLAAVLDEELAKLPDHYRLPILLCELQGRSRKAVAAELGIPEGTLSSRLAAAKQRLADRLTRRGVTTSAGAVAAALTADAAARVPAPLLDDAVRAAAGGLVSAAALRAADGVVKAMFVSKLKGVAVALGLAVAVTGGLAFTPAGAGDDPRPAAGRPADPDPADLVKQLGSPVFADREAAEKKLKALGPKAKPAVRAAMASGDPEVAGRAVAVRDAIRREELWTVFAKVAGDDPAARDLFAKIMGSPRAVDALETALDDPKKADDLFRTRTVELLRVAAGYPPVPAPGEPDRDDLKYIHAPPPVALGDVAGWLLLGTLQPGTKPWVSVTHSGWVNKLSSHIPFLPEDDYTSAKPIHDAYSAKDAAPLKKLTAAWLAKRWENDMLRAGLTLAHRYDIPEGVATARRVLADPRPAAIEPPNIAAAIVLVGQHGTKDDLPVLARHAADDRDHATILNLPKDFQFIGRTQTVEGRDLFCQVRDAAVVGMCKLAGKDPAEFGFPSFPATKHPNGAPRSLTSSTAIGFRTKAARDAAFAKAAAWIKTFEPPPPTDPEAEKQVQRLGAPAFADREDAEKKLKTMGVRAKPAVLAGLRSSDPEIAKRCEAVRDSIRREEHWPRFAQLIGEDQAAKDLYAQVVGRKALAEMLDTVTAEPAKAAEVYFARLDQLNAQVPSPRTIKEDYVDLPDLFGWLYLGTFPGTGGTRMMSRSIRFQRSYIDWTDNPMNRLLGKANDPAAAAARRLVARWLIERRDDDGQWLGLVQALEHDLPEAKAAARAFLQLPGPDAQYAGNRGRTLLVLSKYGTADDVPLLLKFADDKTVCLTLPGPEPAKPPGAGDQRRLGGARAMPPGGPTTQLRDIAVAAAVEIRGGDPKALGWLNRPTGVAAAVAALHRDAISKQQFRYAADHPLLGAHTFKTEQDREAAHAKAKAWLAEHPPAVKPDPEGEKQVIRLGAPAFADREAAEKQLRALGVKAKPAVKAALASADPEVARRAAGIWAAIRDDEAAALVARVKADKDGTAALDHPLWERFKAVAGDDKASRQVFAEIIDDPDRLKRLARVADEPKHAGDEYAAVVVGLSDRVAAAQKKAGLGPNTPRPPGPGGTLTLGEFAGVMFLGTFAGTGFPQNPADPGSREWLLFNTNPNWARVVTGPLGKPVRRLMAAWIGRREDHQAAESALDLFALANMPELLPVARAIAADKARPAGYRSAAIQHLARYGGKAELPLIAALFGEKDEVFRRAQYPGGEMNVQVRDVAVRAALQLYDQDPAEFGFPSTGALGYGDLKNGWKEANPGLKYTRLVSGFFSDADREAAISKARDWLDQQSKPAAPKTDPEAEKLVKQLGAPAFADREAAEKKLLAVPAAAVNAVRAGMTSSDPEIAARSQALLPRLMSAALAVSDHPVWTRFKKSIGDDAATRKLFLDMIADGRRAELLDRAEANPAKANEVYAAELTKWVEAMKEGFRQAERAAQGRTGELLPKSGVPTRGEFATLLFLGTYPATAKVTYRIVGDADRVAYHGVLGFGLNGPGDPAKSAGILLEVRRLFAAWLAVRADSGIVAHGLWLATFHDIKESIPAARAALADEKTDREARGFAALAVGHLGSKDDLPLLEKVLTDDRVFQQTQFTTAGVVMPVTCQVRDAALAAVLHLRGQDPVDYGFSMYQKRKDPDLMKKYHLVGFFDSEGRDAAHAKAKAWLKGDGK
jgi:RNA polymerase sigma factor (sigma-70 family)